MATYTSNYAWAKPSGSDPVDISVLNDNLDSQDGIIHDAFLNMAAPFSESSTYAVGDIVLYGTKTYRCRVAVTTAGSWTGATNWDEYKLSEGGLVAGDYINIQNGVVNVQTEIGTYDYVRYELESTGGGAIKLIVRKYVNNVLDSTTEYPNDGQHHEIDDVMDTWYEYGPYLWHYKLLVASTDHAVGYEESWSYQDTSVHTVNFQFAQDDSTTLVTKGDLDDADGDIYAVMGQMGAKNLILYPYYEADTKTHREVTYTVNSDNTITLSGTANGGTSNYVLHPSQQNIKYPAGTYILSGCPAGGSRTTYWMQLAHGGVVDTFDVGEGATVTLATEQVVGIGIYIAAGVNVTGKVYKPMLRLASDTDATYQPYAKTNKQLTDEIATKVDKVEGKGLSTNDYDNTEKAEVAKVANKADKTATASGETLALVPTSEGRALLHTAYGMSTQSGTPTPSSPVDIESAKADFRSVGKNLIPYPYYDTTKTSNNVTFTDNGDGTVTVSTTSAGASGNVTFTCHTRTPEDVNDLIIKNGKYILTGCPSGGSDSKYRITTGCIKNGGFRSLGIDYGEGVVVTADGDDYSPNGVNIQVTIDIRNGCVLTTPITFKPMLRLADVTDSTYEPYKKTDITTNLTLRAIEVSSTDNYNLVRDGKYYIADTLDYSEDNGWSVTRRIKESVIDGSQSITTSYDGHTMTVNDLYTASECINFLSPNNRFKAIDGNSTTLADANSKLSNGECIKRNNKHSIAASDYFKNTSMTSASDWATWLTSNPITVYDILATPTTENITTAQALALLGLKTYDESTTISSQAEPSCTVAVEYAKERLGALALTAYNTAKGNDLRITALEG